MVPGRARKLNLSNKSVLSIVVASVESILCCKDIAQNSQERSLLSGVSLSQSFGGHVIEEFLTARVISSSPQSLLAGGKSGRHPFFSRLRALSDRVAFGGGDFRSLVSFLQLEASSGEVCFKTGGGRVTAGVGLEDLLFTGGMLSSSDTKASIDLTKVSSIQVNLINLDLMVEEVTLASLVGSTCG